MAAEKEEYVIGVDEAGRGCLFGSVDVCAACILNPAIDPWLFGPRVLRDSKAFASEEERVEVGCALMVVAAAAAAAEGDLPAFLWAHRGATSAQVDAEGNILQTVVRLWHAAIAEVVRRIARTDPAAASEGRVRVVVDGTQFRSFDLSVYPELAGVGYVCLPRADATVPAVSAASILAKNFHDDDVAAIARADPAVVARYDVLRNKGYGTARHIEGIRAHGHSPWHRRSFRIKALEA